MRGVTKERFAEPLSNRNMESESLATAGSDPFVIDDSRAYGLSIHLAFTDLAAGGFSRGMAITGRKLCIYRIFMRTAVGAKVQPREEYDDEINTTN